MIFIAVENMHLLLEYLLQAKNHMSIIMKRM